MNRREVIEAARTVARQCEAALPPLGSDPIKAEVLIQTAASWLTFARLIEMGEYR